MLTQPKVSLSEVHSTVEVPYRASFWRKMFLFAGPAFMVSVGYMDPGNWGTDIEGGARFAYQLLWIILLSNLMAVLLQTLAARLGIVHGRDLAQACREAYPKTVSYILWILCEVAIVACDLAEVLGMVVGLNMLFGLPLKYGVVVTAFDTLLLLAILRLGIRKMEAFILLLIATIGICFVIEIFLAKPVWSSVLTGFVPRLNSQSLYVAIGIIGATVMPHNLYLHSALVQSRRVGRDKAQACRFNLIDSATALNIAFLMNSAILIVSATVFFHAGRPISDLQQAHQLLNPLLGTSVASAAFAIALIAAGQSSTLTGTLAGQIVMEGFLNIRLRPWVRRLLTRSIAIIPAAAVILMTDEKSGNTGIYRLLILSQVILSLQLPFAIVPLIHLTSNRQRMGNFANPKWVKLLAWTAATIIIGLNVRLIVQQIMEWVSASSKWSWLLGICLTGISVSLAILLLRLIFVPLEKRPLLVFPGAANKETTN